MTAAQGGFALLVLRGRLPIVGDRSHRRDRILRPVPYELPDEQHEARGRALWRWVSFALIALLVAAVAYLGYVGWAGSGLAVGPSASRDCRTPAIAYGWQYEAVNYDAASDLRLQSLDDPTSCDLPPARAGDPIVTSDGVRLAGWYIPAAAGIGAAGPTVVLAHGHGGNKSSLLAQAAVLHDQYNLLLFDFRGHGQSDPANSTVGLLERLDLRAAIDWLETSKSPRTIGVLGVSMGGAAAVNEAATDQRVIALVLDSTHATLADALQARLEWEGYPLSLPGAWAILFGGLVRTGQDMSAADPVQAAGRYGSRPLLVIGAGRDDALGSNDAADIADAARRDGAPVELRICAQAGHAQSVEACAADYRTWVLGFFERTLGRGS